MKCECSLSNQHEIVGLCDIQKFNEKINLFVDKSWTQVSISDNLILSGDKPSIKTITKIFIDVKITSTKIVNTPRSDDTNIEGMSLTGKLLLVAGEIFQRVLYVSNNSNLDKITSFKIKTPFTTYIVIDEDVEINEDRYCVFPCIEYASLRPINNKSLSQNVTMFLFARRVPTPFINDIIFKNDNNQELSKIKFDSDINMLEVTSTQSINDGKILKFELYKMNGKTLRKQGTINVNSNSQQFTEDLNKQRFLFYDVINISYDDKPNKVLIKNFPNQGEDYNPKFDRNEAFLVTRKGLVPYALPNKIILKDGNNQEIIQLSFSKFGDKVRVISTGATAPVAFATKDYFRVTLNNEKVKRSIIGTIQGNKDGSLFKNRLDDKVYSIGDTIDIFCEEPNKAEITNYPNKDNTYNLTQKTERFRITATGLEKINIPEYQNEIILKNTTNQELARVKFNVIANTLEVTSTGSRASANDDFTLQLFKASSGVDFTGAITPNTDGTEFKNELNGKPFSIGDVLQITADPPNQAEITNFPNKGVTYNLTEDTERFRITEMGLEKIEIIVRYANEIKLKNQNNQELATIQFDPITNVLRVLPDPTVGRRNDITPIKVELYREDGKTLTASSEIAGNANANKFKEYLEGAFFKYGDVINIIYNSKPNKVEIEDIPPPARPPYMPKLDNNEAFVIAKNGLEPYDLKHKIVSANGNRDIAEVYFSKLNNEIKVFSTRSNAPSKQAGSLFIDYFKIIFFRDNQSQLIGTIPYTQNGSSFKQALELQPYSIGDTLMTISAEELKTRLEDVVTGVITINNNNIIRYEITEKGLIEMAATYLNEIVFKNDSNQEVARVRFALSTQKLFVTKTNNIIQGRGRPVLQFRLYDSNGTTLKANGVISEKAQAVSFVSDLNRKDFQFGDIIKIGYGNFPSRVNITNFPTIGAIYIPKLDISESFVIKQKGLVPYMLKNSIEVFNSRNQLIAEVDFDKSSKQLKVISTGNVAPDFSSISDVNSSIIEVDYFKMMLRNLNPSKESTGTIGNNQNGENLKAILDNKNYKIGDEIEIISQEPSKVIINNSPNIGQVYILNKKIEKFIIEDDKLKKVSIPYLNEIICRNLNNEELARIKFNTDADRLEVTFTGKVQSNATMCLVTVRNGNNIVAEGSIVQNQNAKDFTSKLDAQSYLSGYDIFISTLVGKDNKVEITNYPKVGVIYKLKENLEIFKITDTGLVHIVPYLNEIISRNNNNEELARIKLNPDTKRLEVTSTGKIAPSPAIPNNPNNYLNVVFRTIQGNMIEGVIKEGQNANNFRNSLNNKVYSIRDVFEIESKVPQKTEITNYPRKGEEYKLTNSVEYFTIKETGLSKKQIISKFLNSILFKNENNKAIINIDVEPITNILRCSFPIPSENNDSTPIKVQVYKPDGTTLKASATIESNADGTQFRRDFGIVFFDYEDIIKLSYNGKPHKISIDNFGPNKIKYTPTDPNSESFRIKVTGLEKLTP